MKCKAPTWILKFAPFAPFGPLLFISVVLERQLGYTQEGKRAGPVFRRRFLRFPTSLLPRGLSCRMKPPLGTR